MIECPVCSGLGSVMDNVAGAEITCPVCMGMGLIEAPAPIAEASVASVELLIANGARLVVDPVEPGLRLIYDGGEPADGVKRNCDLNPDDAVCLMSVLARESMKRWGPEVAHRIECAVRAACHVAASNPERT